MALVPSARRRGVAAQAVTYQLIQAHNAYQTALATTPTHVHNALVESSLIHLRALIGFLLADSPGPPYARDVGDVHPAWFLDGQRWQPGGTRHRGALHSLHEAVSKTVAHTVVHTVTHPGEWPIREGLVVVATDLGNLLDQMTAREQARFRSGPHLDSVLPVVKTLDVPYSPGSANHLVRRARRLLRTQLDWP